MQLVDVKTYGFPIPQKPILDHYYLPDTWEDITWSAKVKVPRVPTVGMTYRVREDYYKIREQYTDQRVKAPALRLIGTDVLVHNVEKDYVEIRECYSDITHRLYFKFLRVLQPGETFCPNAYIFKSAISCGSGKHLIQSYESGRNSIRFKLRPTRTGWSLIFVYTVLVGTSRRSKTHTLVLEDLEEIVSLGLQYIIEEYGPLNSLEQSLYNALASKTLKEHPYIEHCLNSALY